MTLDDSLDISNLSYEQKCMLIDGISSYSALQESKQLSKKLRMNSLYGAISAIHFILFNRDIASSITFVCRSLIQNTSIKIDKMFKESSDKGHKVCYNDTDSISYNSKIRIYKNDKIR